MQDPRRNPMQFAGSGGRGGRPTCRGWAAAGAGVGGGDRVACSGGGAELNGTIGGCAVAGDGGVVARCGGGVDGAMVNDGGLREAVLLASVTRGELARC